MLNSGIKLWQKAKKYIPGGNGLLSKRPERYVPDVWPTYFSKAKGVNIWDLDGNKYIDMSQMGIGTAVLGYGDDDVNEAVKKAVNDGVNTTLNAPEEVYLAEKLLELNAFAGGVRFARSGGEAMAIAVRIARAFGGKEKIAFSGYHGWSDWYLASNLGSESNLDGHLLPGLKPKGVPRGLVNTAFPFNYNDAAGLRRIAEKEDIGVIVFEGPRYNHPTKEFLDAIKKIGEEKKAVIIMDEITSGWRATDGGAYKLYNFTPDIVVYGKAMGNGFAISAIVGKKNVMDAAQDTFISSTFWTERIGFVAALKTIEKIVAKKVWKRLLATGRLVGDGWLKQAAATGLKIHVTEFEPLITFKFEYGDKNYILETVFIKEMLKRGYIASNSIYASYVHDEKIVEKYLDNVGEVFGIITDSLKKGNLAEVLGTQPRDDSFKRLT